MTSSEDRIKEETSISMEIREILNFYPTTDLTPVALTKWAERIVKASKSNGINDKKIRQWIRMYARESHWSDSQINAVLRYNDLI